MNSFEALWSYFDQYYAGFAARHINWDSIHVQYRARVSDAISSDSLFTVLSALVRELKDAHVSLWSEGRFTRSDTLTYGATSAFDPSRYPQELGRATVVTPDRKFRYGRTSDSIGYIRIEDFDPNIRYQSSQNPQWYNGIDDILDSIGAVRGLIIDVRANPGGEETPALGIAGRFVTTSTNALFVSERSGPDHPDFTAPVTHVITRAGRRQIIVPIALLANRNTVSAAEWFSLMARQCFHAVLVGDTTRGVLSGFITRELPNGWIVTIPGERVTTMSGVNYEGTGIPPDIYAPMSSSDVALYRDPVLAAALKKLRE